MNCVAARGAIKVRSRYQLGQPVPSQTAYSRHLPGDPILKVRGRRGSLSDGTCLATGLFPAVHRAPVGSARQYNPRRGLSPRGKRHKPPPGGTLGAMLHLFKVVSPLGGGGFAARAPRPSSLPSARRILPQAKVPRSAYTLYSAPLQDPPF